MNTPFVMIISNVLFLFLIFFCYLFTVLIIPIIIIINYNYNDLSWYHQVLSNLNYKFHKNKQYVNETKEIKLECTHKNRNQILFHSEILLTANAIATFTQIKLAIGFYS